MENQIAISYPESLAYSLKMGNQEFEHEMKIISLVKLYEMGKISSGFASRLMNISRIDFLQNLAKYNISYFHKELEDELESDFQNA
jgi:predicted HTH domain antitoxin